MQQDLLVTAVTSRVRRGGLFKQKTSPGLIFFFLFFFPELNCTAVGRRFSGSAISKGVRTVPFFWRHVDQEVPFARTT